MLGALVASECNLENAWAALMDFFLDTAVVSVVVPCRNEKRYIANCLDSIRATDFPKHRLEILVVDGGSDDGTREVLNTYAKDHPLVRVIDNPDRTTPHALNIGIRHAHGDVIVRMDAHASYPLNYISALLREMQQSGADNVGGVLDTYPGTDSPVAKAIAMALSHPFGVGNAYYRVGTNRPRWVDTVPFGCYRREVFDRIGLFDEDLIRNQDDELNSRLIKAGGRILLVPEIRIKYFARTTLTSVWRMYWQYGYFKPLCIRKLGTVVTLRHLVPAAFVASLAISAAAAPFNPVGSWALLAIAGSYAGANLIASAHAARDKSKATLLALCAAFACTHIAFGLGFLRGIWHFGIRSRSGLVTHARIPLSR